MAEIEYLTCILWLSSLFCLFYLIYVVQKSEQDLTNLLVLAINVMLALLFFVLKNPHNETKNNLHLPSAETQKRAWQAQTQAQSLLDIVLWLPMPYSLYIMHWIMGVVCNIACQVLKMLCMWCIQLPWFSAHNSLRVTKAITIIVGGGDRRGCSFSCREAFMEPKKVRVVRITNK